MNHIDAFDLQQLKRELEALPRGWLHRTAQRSLIRPAYPQEAAEPSPFVRAQAWREILSRTPARLHLPRRPGTADTNPRSRMLDTAKIRHLYFNPPTGGPPPAPSREEFYGRVERRAVEYCILAGGDPRAQGLGENGALIGGPGERARHFSRDPDLRQPSFQWRCWSWRLARPRSSERLCLEYSNNSKPWRKRRTTLPKPPPTSRDILTSSRVLATSLINSQRCRPSRIPSSLGPGSLHEAHFYPTSTPRVGIVPTCSTVPARPAHVGAPSVAPQATSDPVDG